MHYLITGGAGFIGAHLAEALIAQGHAVRVLDDFSTGKKEWLPPPVEVLTGDVALAEDCRRAADGVDGIFHLAAIASVERCTADPARARLVNVEGLRQMVAASAGAPVVFASSAAVYGDAGENFISETVPTQPLSQYGSDKLAAEACLKNGVALRFFNVYGPRQQGDSPYSGVISIFAEKLNRGETLTLHGDGEQSRDFVYVQDVVAHLSAAMARLQAGAALPPAMNVCTGQAISVRGLAEAMADCLGVELRAQPGPARNGDIRHSLGNPALARESLGIVAGIGLEEGLKLLLH